MKNKLRAAISLMLCIFFMATAFVPCVTAFADGREIIASGTSGNLSWTLYGDGELYISGKSSPSVMLWKEHSKLIKRITIAKDVMSSSSLNFYFNDAAGYPNLEFVSVEEGNTAFYADENGILFSYNKRKLYLFPNASGIKEYSIPDGVETVVNGAFCGNKILESVSGGKDLKTINTDAFYCCSGLKSISLPEGVETIGNYAFFKCTSLKSIVIPDSATALGNYCFRECTALETAVIGKSVALISTEAFVDCANLKTLTLKGVSNISRSAFKNCSSLETLVIPEGVTSIEERAFYGCVSLESVTLPSTILYFGNSAFEKCSEIKSFYFNGTEYNWCRIAINGHYSTPLYYTENFYVKGKLITDFVIPDGVKAVSSYLLSGYDKLKTVTIPDTVTEIKSYAFMDCPVLENVVIPESVIKIGNQAFARCSILSDIKLPKSLVHIGDGAFYSSGYYKDAANWDNGFLYIGNYLVGVDEKKVAADCRPYSKTKLIASSAFNRCSTITSVTLPDGVEYIGDYAFAYCSNLTSIKLSESLKTIGEWAFAGCNGLESIVLPESVEYLGETVFNSCTSLTSIEIPGKVKTIGMHAFWNCENLKTIKFNEGLEEIGYEAFLATPSLLEVYIPSTLKTLAANAFKNSGVTDIYYGSSKADWKRAAAGETFDGITVHYTLRSEDESVIINHTDSNFNFEAGNVHLVVEDLGSASSSYEQNGFYNNILVKPIQVLDIKLVDGDGNPIQPLSDEKITVKIKASDEFMNLMKSGLSSVSDYDVEANEINFANDCFVLEINGEIVRVPAPDNFLKKFKIIHWYSDATKPTHHEGFTHSEITVKDGYIILQTSHFSEYAVCTDLTALEDYTVKWIVDGVETEQTVTEGYALSAPANPEKDGYSFVGWTPEVPKKMPAENLEFTAVWQVNEYTITFDTDGGTEIAPITLEYGAAITPPAKPEKEGYTFIGWSPEIPETMPANDITVVAQYEKNEEPADPDTPETPTVKVTGIKVINLPNKTQYLYKDKSLDLSGIALKVMYSDGKSEIITDTEQIEAYGFNASSVGTKTITVSYGGYTDEFEITVSYSWWQMIIRILLLGFLWY